MPKAILISANTLAELEADGPLVWRLHSGVPCVATLRDPTFSSAVRRILGAGRGTLIVYRDGDPLNLTLGNLGMRTSYGTDHFVDDVNPLDTAPWPVLRARGRLRKRPRAVLALPATPGSDDHQFFEYD